MTHKILIVEDDARTRERLAAVISTITEMQLLAAIGSCAEARAALTVQTPDVLLLDLGLPDGDGTDLIPEALQAGAQVIVLTVFKEGPRQRTALLAGARYCLLKDSSALEIGRALNGVFDTGPPAPAHENHHFL